MTAEPITGHSSRWPVPPQDGYTVDDLFTLPDLPPHTELLDGSLVLRVRSDVSIPRPLTC